MVIYLSTKRALLSMRKKFVIIQTEFIDLKKLESGKKSKKCMGLVRFGEKTGL
jgi:hypothetical protein